MAAFKTFLFLLHIDLITTAHVSLCVYPTLSSLSFLSLWVCITIRKIWDHYFSSICPGPSDPHRRAGSLRCHTLSILACPLLYGYLLNVVKDVFVWDIEFSPSLPVSGSCCLPSERTELCFVGQ